MDLKKEIKLSDLFKRRPRPEPKLAAPAETRANGEKKSFLRRDLQLSRRGRKASEAGSPAKPKEPTAGKLRGRPTRGAPAVPQVPLMRAFNLLPREEVRETRTTRPGPVQLGLAVAGLVLLTAIASIFLITNARVADKERRHDELRGELAARNVRSQAPRDSGDATLVQERDARTSALASALGQRIAWDRLLRDVSLVLPEDVWLRSLRATNATPASATEPTTPSTDPAAAPKSTFEMVGYTRKQEDVALLLSRMSVLPEVAGVQLVSAQATKVGEEDVIEFTITATVKSVGAGVTP